MDVVRNHEQHENAKGYQGEPQAQDEPVIIEDGPEHEEDIEGSEGNPHPLTESQTKEVLRHIQEGHIKKSKLCRACLESEGVPRRHMSHEHKRVNIVHIDIAGPMTQGWDGSRYFLVMALRIPEFPLILHGKTLISRHAAEVAT